MGDALGCAIVQELCTEELAEMDREKEMLGNGDGDVLLQGRADVEIGSTL